MSTKAKDRTCKERVWENFRGRMEDLQKLWKAYQSGSEDVPDLGNIYEYGLAFDYVPPGTWKNDDGTPDMEGYFRYQLSWGGPSDEFRFFTGPEFVPFRIEYWFLDWYDGASITLFGEDKKLMLEIFDGFKEVGAVHAEFEKSKE